MKKRILQIFFCFALTNGIAYAQSPITSPKKITLTKEQLKDKIMGGWAGQTIGVTFGGPYEFRFEGTFIQNYEPLLW